MLTNRLEGQRVVVLFHGRPAAIRQAQFRILVQMLAARLTSKSGAIHKTDLSSKKDEGFVGVARLKKELTDSRVDPDVYLKGDNKGGYWIRKNIELGRLDTPPVRDLELGDARIDDALEAIDEAQDAPTDSE